MTEKKASTTRQLPAVSPANPAADKSVAVATHNSQARYFWLLLLLIMLAGTASYYWLQQHLAKMQTTATSLTQQIDQFTQQLGQLTHTQQQTQQQISQQQQLLTQVQQQLSQQQQQKQLILQLQWLINNANQQLLAYHNIDNSLQLLRDSQQLLPNAPQFSLLAQALEQDIQTLAQLPKSTANAQVAQLMTLADQAASLPFPTLSTPANTAANPPPDSNWRQRLWHNSQQFLQQFITVTPRDNHYQLPLSSQQHYWLQENLRSYLLLASQAVWHQQPSIYQQALHSAIALINRYFASSDTATVQFLQQLQQLQQQPLPSEWPGSLKSQQALIRLQHQQTAPIAEPATKD